MSVIHDERPLPHASVLFPHLHADPGSLPLSLDPFTVTTTTGFLPLKAPQVDLPLKFAPLASILDDLPILRRDGHPGLLAQNQLGRLIDSGALPNLTDSLDDLVAEDGKPDLAAITAVFRDYAFLASAYLLEPCWDTWSKDNEGGYGLGRHTLPACIAGPLVRAAVL